MDLWKYWRIELPIYKTEPDDGTKYVYVCGSFHDLDWCGFLIDHGDTVFRKIDGEHLELGRLEYQELLDDVARLTKIKRPGRDGHRMIAGE